MSRPDIISKRTIGEVRSTRRKKVHKILAGKEYEGENASARILVNQGEFPGELEF